MNSKQLLAGVLLAAVATEESGVRPEPRVVKTPQPNKPAWLAKKQRVQRKRQRQKRR